MAEPRKCPKCGSKKIHFHKEGKYDGEETWLCDECQHKWDCMIY